MRYANAAMASVLVTLAAMTESVQGSVNVAPAATIDTASSLSSTLSPSYIGMGIEPSNLFAFVGTTSPNPLTNNLLSNLANYTGIPPHIRVGGNTEDTMVYSSSYNGYYLGNNPDTTSDSDSMLFGPKYFQAVNNLPSKTPVSLGIGLTYNGSDALNMSVAIARQAVTTLTNVNLVGFEVGNEPDLYIQNGFRPSDWSINDYGNEWIQRVEAIYTEVLKPNNIGTAFFEAACTATTAAFPAYKISNLVGTGLGTGNGLYLAGWNQHDYYYYVGVSDYTLTLSGLLQLSSTSGQFTAWSEQASEAAVTGKPYYVREMGSVGPAGLQGISNTFANCLWTLNFFLFSSTVGVDSVQIHMLQDSYGSPWQPIKDTNNAVTFVRPNYYAFAAFNQILGAKCATRVAQTTLSGYPSNYGNRLAAYSVYDGNDLQTLVLLNTQVAYSGSNSIGSQQFVISLPTLAGQTFYLSLLSAAGADATSNVTWNNMDYEQSGDGNPTILRGTANSTQVGSDGTLRVTVRDSQIVVANLGSVIGSQNNVVDTKACAALAATTSEGGASSTTAGKGAAPTFKATTGFKSTGLSLGAIIGIAAGGGVALLILLIIIIACCVRRSRRNKRLAAYDNKTLLPPSKVRSYANVPQRDSLDSSDIWMTPMGVKKSQLRYDQSGTSTPYMGSHSRGNSGSSTPFKTDHSRGDTSYDPSLNDSPLIPQTHSMREYAPQSSDGHGGSYGNIPVSASMPLTSAIDQRRSFQAQPAISSKLANNVSYPELPVFQRGRMQSHPGQTPDSLIPGQQSGGARGRHLSTPAQSSAGITSQGQEQVQRFSIGAGPTAGSGAVGAGSVSAAAAAAAAYHLQRPREAAYGNTRRSPSVPNTGSSPTSRHQSPNRLTDRNVRSHQGHTSSSSSSWKRGYESGDTPPVPPMPSIQRPREPMPPSRASMNYTTSHAAGPRQQPPSRASFQQYQRPQQQQYNNHYVHQTNYNQAQYQDNNSYEDQQSTYHAQ